MTGLDAGSVNIERFRFLNHHYDPATGEAVLGYAFDDGEAIFERLRFPFRPWPADASRQAAFTRALGLLHLVAGVSYYKTCVPRSMDTGDHSVDPPLAEFLTGLYTQGLAEFAWQNMLDIHARVKFQVNGSGPGETLDLDLPERALVAMGGGKDSLVSLETMRAAGLEIQPVCVGISELIADTVRSAGLPLIAIERTLSPVLAKMNEAGALNGHVPVTAINSAILVCAAILYGYRWVVFSNESSASEATLSDEQGRPVNHQYSKSLEFERALRSQIAARISPGIEYFSLLRPLNELAIAQRFAGMTQYHEVFSSCNRNFHLDGSRIPGRWCGQCPKCRFTALALAPHLAPDRLQAIMGVDMLGQPGQEEGFRALCRLGVEKPFECVGGVNESRAAMVALGGRPEWASKQVVRELAAELRERDVADLETVLAARGEHCIPRAVERRVALG
jgi:hypothetical protein